MKISNPRMLAGNAALATQAYVNKASGALSEQIEISISNLSATTSGIISNVSNEIYTTINSVSGDLNTTISTVSGALDEEIGIIASSYMSKSELLNKLDGKDKIKAELLPPISITSVTTVDISDVLKAAEKSSVDNTFEYLQIYFSGESLQEGDIVIVNTTNPDLIIQADNAALLGPWIVSAPGIDSETEPLTFTKLIFPTTDVNFVNGIAPDTAGNVKVALSGLADYTNASLSALYQVAYNTELERLGTYQYNKSGIIDNIKYYATSAELDTVSGKLDVVSNKLDKTAISLDSVKTVTNKVSGNLENIYSILSSGAFFTDSITFISANDSTVQSNILKTKVNIKRTLTKDSTEFGTTLSKYSYEFSFGDQVPVPEIVAVYSVDSAGKQENFYPDVIIEVNIFTISLFVIDENELPENIKIVYSNYKDVYEIM